MTEIHLAQLNIARSKTPLDSPALADFMGALARINALAEASPGFVWRLQTADGDATAVRAFEDPRVIVNLSVWTSIDALSGFVFRSAHADIMRRRREWFEPIAEAYAVLWWVPAGSLPTMTEAEDRLSLLRRLGPTRDAFTLKDRFEPSR